MPAIVEGRCSACGAAPEKRSTGYLAVFMDEPLSGRDAHPEDSHLLILPHPGEESILRRHGHTFASAAREGRLVCVSNVACRSCGIFYTIRRPYEGGGLVLLPGWGCLFVIFLPLFVAIGVGFVLDKPVEALPTCFVIFLALLYSIERFGRRIVQERHQARAPRVTYEPGCPSCKSPSYATVGDPCAEIPCRMCAEKAIKFHMVGKS
jgi:hypothetical protein